MKDSVIWAIDEEHAENKAELARLREAVAEIETACWNGAYHSRIALAAQILKIIKKGKGGKS